MLWCSFSSVGWNLTNVLIHEVVHIWSHVFGVSNILLLWQVLECWVQDTIDGMLFSWIWGWVDAVVSIDETMDLFSDVFVSNISLIFL